MQDRRRIAFESWKLNGAERKYTVQEKETTVVVHCLRTWRHYLLGAQITVYTDNVVTCYFQTQKKPSPKQARWQDFLPEFDYELVYKTGRSNVVAAALSRRAGLATITVTQTNVMDTIKAGLEIDPMTSSLKKLVEEGNTREFWLEEGLLLTKGKRIYVLRFSGLRKAMNRECHDTKWARHPGQRRTRALQSESTRKSPFEIATGRQPMTPHALLAGVDTQSPTQLKSLRQVSKRFLRRYEGPFEVFAKIGKSFCLQACLPANMKIHSVVHVSMLKPYNTNLEEPSCGELKRAPPLVFQSFDRGIKEILVDKVVKKKGVGGIVGKREGLMAISPLDCRELCKESGQRAATIVKTSYRLGDEGVAGFDGRACYASSTHGKIFNT
ncbi:hypothetical protein V2J09_023374 [Rumex salicifolius]